VEVERALTHGRYIDLTGYVAWPSPAPSAPVVHAHIGDVVLATAPADRARPDVVDRLPDRASTVRCGFDFVVPRPDDGSIQLTVTSSDGRTATVPIGLLPPMTSTAPEDSRLPPPSALEKHTDPGAAVLDWNACVAASGVPVTVFTPLSPRDRLLPYLTGEVDYVVVPHNVREDQRTEALRVARLAVLIPDSFGEGYKVEKKPEWHSRTLADRSVSIVIPVYGQGVLTDACLRAILADDASSLDLEIIVVDDASPDVETSRTLAAWAQRDPRIRLVRLDTNVGYLRAVKRGATDASGNLLVLLNNDTQPQPGWLLALAETFEQRPSAGVVGSLLVDPDRTLQDAGGIVFADGSAWNLGRGSKLGDPEFNYVRPVDYCTAAGLATPLGVWRQLGGFDERFVPAYYEDVDYAFAARAAGYEVLIQPASVVIHEEGQSHGTDIGSGIKAHQRINRQRFVDKWREPLAAHAVRPNHFGAKELRQLVLTRRK
jgi:GT2 family glycosyltransferase